MVVDRISKQKHVWRAQVVLMPADRAGTIDHAADPALQAVGLPLAEAADDDSGTVSATPSSSSSR
jgi:SAM-dependent MidA family methyltransferase